MNTKLITSLRIAVSVLVLVIFFSPANANAYTSNGTDGQFQPNISMILDTTQQIFNFTSIFIPSDVTVSFSGLASARSIELLATGNIDIAGTLDAGANNLWIETPGSIFLSGSLYSSGGDLSLVASTINFSGIINRNDALIDRGAVISLGRDAITGKGIITGRGTLVLTKGGTLVTNEGGDISICSNCSIPPPVPEPEVWVMLLLGLCALFAVSRLRYQNTRLA